MTDRELMQQALDALKLIDEAMPFPMAKLTIKNLRDRLAQPNEFEPDWDQVEALQESLREHMAEIRRLRSVIKQSRQWQGLTDDESNQFRQWAHPDIIEAIELKLKEKNDV